ncbi:MAG: hypothetical protein BWY17_01764 [Deltaproteobacteria bacterium ADurb.Bin207]|jgi:hypothetical protein|nr:MAG: hypothetical protein BWY17_01764 [Deltaproteobacteria bacterium ADurb.Bin207]
MREHCQGFVPEIIFILATSAGLADGLNERIDLATVEQPTE